jgi:hypothetical protein
MAGALIAISNVTPVNDSNSRHGRRDANDRYRIGSGRLPPRHLFRFAPYLARKQIGSSRPTQVTAAWRP